MNPIYVWYALSGIIAILAISTCVFAYFLVKGRIEHRKLLAVRTSNVMADLELATSDQLLSELRKRPGVPYLMLVPLESEDHKGMSIEIHNIPPVPSVQMLHLAAALTLRELKNRGVDIPEMPHMGEEGEEWKKPSSDD